MTLFQSAQQFIKALKAQTDPPVADGLLKIDLAEQAWNNAAFHLPNKAEVIADWILSKFFKDRGNKLPSNALANERYWKLLSALIASTDPHAQTSPSLQTKIWLKPLLNRVSIAPIVNAFLNLWSQTGPWQSGQLMLHAALCISILYPLGTQKLSTEAFLESWGTFLNSVEHLTYDLSSIKIGLIVTRAYSNSLNNATSRKKLNLLFVQNETYFQAWLRRLDEQPFESQHEYLRQATLACGVDTIFNLDTLRQMADTPEDSPLFLALSKALQFHRNQVLKVLPVLLNHYVASVKRHRGAIIVASSSSRVPDQNELSSVSMEFFSSLRKLVDTQKRDILAWDAVSEMADILGRENVYNPRGNVPSTLKRDVDVALASLSELHDDQQASRTPAVARCLSAVIRVDYDHVLPVMSLLLIRLLTISRPHSNYFTLLELLLEYHIKTRTVDHYIETLISCLPAKSMPVLSSAQDRYLITQSSPVLHPKHLEQLSRATRQFLTSGQCRAMVDYVCKTLRSLHEECQGAQHRDMADRSDGSRKSRKSDAMPGGQHDLSDLALTFALAGKISQTVLSSIPITSLPQDQTEQLQCSLAEFQAEFVQHNLLRSVKAFARADHVTDETSSKRKKTSDNTTWGSQVMLVALLRLHYTLRVTRSLDLPNRPTQKLSKRLLEISMHSGDEVIPELSLEIFRALLDLTEATDEAEVSQSIDLALKFVDKRLIQNLDVTWSGFAHELAPGQAGRAQSGLAVLHIILERWLPVIELAASEPQLKTLAKLVLRTPLDIAFVQDERQRLTAGHLLFRTLRSAQFWEFSNLRSALVSHLLDVLSGFEIDNITQTSPQKQVLQEADLRELVATFRLLLFFPAEYFSKSCRRDLTKKAVRADWIISQQSRGFDGSTEAEGSLATLRAFLTRALGSLGWTEEQSPSDMAKFILHLLDDSVSATQAELSQTTLDLFELYLIELLKRTHHGDSAQASKVLATYQQYPIFDRLNSIRGRSFIRSVELLTKEFSFTSFSPDLQKSLHELHSHLSTNIYEKLHAVIDASHFERLSAMPDLLTYWNSLLCLGRWLSVEALEKCFGPRLVQRFSAGFFKGLQDTPNNWLDRTVIMMVAILLQEMHYGEVGLQNKQLSVVVATYIAHWGYLSVPGRASLDQVISKACLQFSPSGFQCVLSLIEGALSGVSSGPIDSSELVHLATVLLRDHPPNTLKIMQAFFTQWMDIFTNSDDFAAGSAELRLQALEFVAQHCSERPATLRSLDIGSIWLFLYKCLAPSSRHEKTTSSATFHQIIATASAIIRLRRDLTIPMLPHLGLILRQLILSMRQCRPQLASKQTEMVMNTQPRWISASQPLGAEEAKALSRLLETLITKTITRVHTPSAEAQKAESLAAPFSKHAAYVLKAYIEAMNDPLSVLTLEVRKELHPGLYALCSMIGEYSRDALMVSGLDAGGKGMMKALWKEYEKQRYAGQG